MEISEEIRRSLLDYQRNEITEYHTYRRLAATIPSSENRRVLEKIADDELRHYEQWRSYTRTDVAPDRWAVRKYCLLSRLLGFTFAVKLMELAEDKAQSSYEQL